jgi:hypothetical protein
MSQFVDLAADSLSSIGQLGIEQSPSPEQLNQALRYANRMIQKWSTLRYYIYSVASRSFAMTPGLQDYVLGPTAAGPGSFVGARPVFVEASQVQSPGSSEYLPLNLLDRTKWGAIRDKGATCSANGVPQDIFINMQYPNLDFHLWPVPSNTCTVWLSTWELLQQFVTVFDTISLPPGYEEALMWNLALELCSSYDMAPPPTLPGLAGDGLLRIQAINAQMLGGALGESQTLQSPNLAIPPPTGGGGGQ